MQVKKFEAPTIQEALDYVKRELGPEAIILQTKKHKRGFGLMSKASVEVTAAVSERSLNKKQSVEVRLPEANRTAMQKLPAERQANLLDKYTDRNLANAARTKDRVEFQKKITATRYVDIDNPNAAAPATPSVDAAPLLSASPVTPTREKRETTLENEVRQLKQMLEELKNSQDTSSLKLGGGAKSMLETLTLDLPTLQAAFEELIINGVDRRYAYVLVKKVAFDLGPERAKDPEQVAETLAAEMMETFQVYSPLNHAELGKGSSPTIIALVGPTGTGKTTTVAKLCGEAMKKKLRVGLINLDDQKPSAFDQLGTYAKILNAPFRSSTSADDLKAAIQDFKGLDWVIIDTPGRSQRDPDALQRIRAMLLNVPELRAYLTLSVTTRDNELYDSANRFACFHPQGIIFSKLDEATVYGSIYNVTQKSKIPLLYFTTGQKIPEDIEEATRERVVSLVMNL